MSACQAVALALAQPGERGEQHHRPEAWLDRVGQSDDLVDARDTALGAPLGRGAPDPAWVLTDQSVLDGALHHLT